MAVVVAVIGATAGAVAVVSAAWGLGSWGIVVCGSLVGSASNVGWRMGWSGGRWSRRDAGYTVCLPAPRSRRAGCSCSPRRRSPSACRSCRRRKSASGVQACVQNATGTMGQAHERKAHERHRGGKSRIRSRVYLLAYLAMPYVGGKMGGYIPRGAFRGETPWSFDMGPKHNRSEGWSWLVSSSKGCALCGVNDKPLPQYTNRSNTRPALAT
eukprot:8806581-Pyramimonas_sp.AAC.1